MIVTFFGHGDRTADAGLQDRLTTLLRSVLLENPDCLFYLGDYGFFDRLCNTVLRSLQVEFPACRRIFVTPYRDEDYLSHRGVDLYDEVLVSSVDLRYKRFAISRRNEWMVLKADLVIAYIDGHYSRAYPFYEYALRKGKRTINLGKLVD